MKLAEFRYLADENIDPEVVATLCAKGLDTVHVTDIGLCGRPDEDVMTAAVAEGRVLPTHDSDFGRLAIAQGRAFVGIVYLRPGHIDPATVLSLLNHGLEQPFEVEVPFIVVARRGREGISIRVRQIR